MRLATYNVLHGRSLSDGLVVRERLREAVAVLDADVLGMQEVDRFQDRSHRLDLTAEVADVLGAPDGSWRFQPALLGTPGGAWRAADTRPAAETQRMPAGTGGSGSAHLAGVAAVSEDSPAYGISLVTRLPVRRWHSLPLGTARVRSPVLLPGTRRLIWLRDEPRLALAAEVDAPWGRLTVATTHLSFVPGWNAVQLRRLCRWLAGLPSPTVLLGDFNLPGPVPAWLTGWRSLARTRTYPTGDPSVQLDHVLGRGPLPAVAAAEAVSLPVSDHCALVVDLSAG